MRTLIIIPTYNEKENIQELVPAIEAEGLALEILVVDSASPDQTAEAVEAMKARHPRLHLYRQHAKLGLGRAYLEGMQWALAQGYEVILTMDADFSHHPRYLKEFLKAIETHDLVVGSRYVSGGGQKSWPLHRRILSRFANLYARLLMRLPLHDLTSGFHCFRAGLLKPVLDCRMRTEGYAFLMELKYLAVLHGARVQEIPIIFSDRTKGDSKISKRVILESVLFVLSHLVQSKKILRPLPESSCQSAAAR